MGTGSDSDSELSVAVALTYHRGLSCSYGADDQRVTGQRVLGQLGVSWVVQVRGLGRQA